MKEFIDIHIGNKCSDTVNITKWKAFNIVLTVMGTSKHQFVLKLVRYIYYVLTTIEDERSLLQFILELPTNRFQIVSKGTNSQIVHT